MDDLLTRLASFVALKDTRLACASAVVLAELAPPDPAVTRALAEALEKADAARSPFLIEALGRIGTPQAAAALAPLIEAGGPSGDEALRAVAHAGSGALKPLSKLLGRAGPALQVKLAEALARTGESPAFGALFGAWRDAVPETVRALHAGILHALPGLSPKGRQVLLRHVAGALGAKAWRKQEAAFLAALELAGELGEPEALQALSSHIGASAPPLIRRTALRAIGRLRLDPAVRARMGKRLLPLLAETDYANAVEPALAALSDAALGSEHRKALEQLIDSERTEVREFAMRNLATLGSSRTLQDLVDCLDHTDRSVREDAATALAGAPGAAAPLAARMLKRTGGEESRLAARILQGMAEHIPTRILGALARKFVELAAGHGPAHPHAADARREADERRGALLAVLRASGHRVLAEVALPEARKLRLKGEAARALGVLKSIAGVDGWEGGHRMELALAGLSVVPPDLSRAARDSSPSLRLLAEVLAEPKSNPKILAKSLLRDRALERKVLYFIGHHFSERMHGEREFGRVILQGLAQQPRQEEGRQAREKLVLEGLAKRSKDSRRGVLEERAQVLMMAADMAAKAAAAEARKAAQKMKKAGRRPAKKKPGAKRR